MKYFRLLFLLNTFSLLFTFNAYAFPDTNNSGEITADTTVDEVNLVKYSFYFNDINNHLSIDQIKNTDWVKFTGIPTFQPGNSTHWFKIIIDNNYDTDIDKILYIPYVSIYDITVYQIWNDTLQKIRHAGTKNPIDKEEVKMVGYPITLHLKAGSMNTVYVRFKHVYRPLRATMYLLGTEKFQQILYQSTALLWLWRGIYFFAVIASFIAWLYLRRNSFLYYALLNIGVSLYVFSHLGEVELLFGSDPTDFSSVIDYMGAFLINMFLPRFLNTLTPIQKYNKNLWKIITYLTFGMLPLITLSFVPAFRLNYMSYFFHNYIMIVSGIVLLIQVYFLLKNALKKRENALILLIVYVIYINFSFFDIIFPNMGITGDNNFICKRFFTGSFIEVFSFMFLMSRKTLEVYFERAKLQNEQKKLQKKLLVSIVQSQETERRRTGRELHDLIGANMAVIKQKTSDADAELKLLVSNTIDEIRNLSHGLSVADIDGNVFEDEVKELCFTASTPDMKINPFFHKWPEITNKSLTTHLFRITQELIQNAVKHSKAEHVFLQFTGAAENKLFLMYEDDGIGFNTNELRNYKGQGFKNIKNRTELINARFQIESNTNGSGTTVFIELPYKYNNT